MTATVFSASLFPDAGSRGSAQRFLFIYLVGMVLLWTVLCAISHKAPDLDGMEELVWASSLEWGYSKHPPLPSWFMWGLVELFGRPLWLTFFAGQLVSALGLWFVFLLGCEFTTPRRSLIATLMVSVILYFSLRGTIYNHNTAQLWSVAASTWLLFRGLRDGRMADWFWLGVVAGLAMLTKYSALVQFAAFFLFMLFHGHLRRPEVWKGIALAALVFALIFLPHLIWLVSHDFAPLRYADRSMETDATYAQIVLGAVDFALDQLARISPMMVLWIVLWWWQRRDAAPTLHTLTTQTYAQAIGPQARAFIWWIGFGPLVVTLLIAVVLAIQLVSAWGTTFFILFGFYSFWFLKGSDQVWLQRTAVVVIALQVLMAVGYAVARGPLAYEAGRMTRSTFPGPELAAKVQDIWSSHVPDQPLLLVASDTWFGGNIATNISDQTQVFISADYFQSPWLDPDTALDCGVMVLYSPDSRGYWSAELMALYERMPIKGQFTQQWSSDTSPVFTVQYGALPPTAACKAVAR